ncbi:hypothetical protein D9756_004723 [Leucocoprinus leucothites]|uniref:Bud22 domain-containing protein n=1 Tax=Leucocoprinus leucothites TaxID=201217 RepID=A0A8H5LKI9_9AGAR|nr:hypothetical protein D9756_004723 [Leucoagaricus leucothites]
MTLSSLFTYFPQHHGLKEVRKAAKKAKAFETQKLVKKLKDLRFGIFPRQKYEYTHGITRKRGEKATDIAEHEAQLDVLKSIDHEKFANTATKTKIMKDKLLSKHEQVQISLSQELGDKILSTSPKERPAAKVHSRLLSSKILATEILSLCEDLRQLLGHQPKKSRREDDAGDQPEASRIAKILVSQKGKTMTNIHAGAEFEVSPDEEERIIDGTGWESGTVDEEEEPNADNWDSGISSGNKEPEDSESENDIKSGRHMKLTQAVAKQPSSATSTFLPSLSVGFIRGSDESDWSDAEAKLADSGQKKNRRGQRARRAIWEKKYGRNANHKKKELEAQNKLRESADKNKQKGVHRSFQRPPRLNIATDGGKQSPNSEPRPSQPINQPLHPSWEAKRKLKEQQSAGIRLSQGTKIKFSD